MSVLSSTRKVSNYNIGNSGNSPNVFYINTPGRSNKTIYDVTYKRSGHRRWVTEKYISGYDYIKELGSGRFSEVSLYHNHKTQTCVAVKGFAYMNHGKDINLEEKEYGIMLRINHPNIVRYFEFLTIESSYKCYIVMEFAKRGTLRNVLNDQMKKNVLFDQSVVLPITRDIINGMHYLSSIDIVHGDLKPENILVGDDGRIKICDFFTEHFVYDINTPLPGTTSYMAPELFNGMQPDEKTDVWAIGIIFYELCTLHHPFEPFVCKSQLIPKIILGSFEPFDCPGSGFSYKMQQLLEFMLHKDRNFRQNLSNILMFLNNIYAVYKLMCQIKSTSK